MKSKETDHPFYRPLWRRIAIVAVVTAWFLYELLVGQDGFWTMLSGAMLGYAVWIFLISWNGPKDPPPASGDRP